MLTTWSKGGVWFLLVWSHNQVDGFGGECFVGGVEGGGGGGGEGGGSRWREHWIAEKKKQFKKMEFKKKNIGSFHSLGKS